MYEVPQPAESELNLQYSLVRLCTGSGLSSIIYYSVFVVPSRVMTIAIQLSSFVDSAICQHGSVRPVLYPAACTRALQTEHEIRT